MTQKQRKATRYNKHAIAFTNEDDGWLQLVSDSKESPDQLLRLANLCQ